MRFEGQLLSWGLLKDSPSEGSTVSIAIASVRFERKLVNAKFRTSKLFIYFIGCQQQEQHTCNIHVMGNSLLFTHDTCNIPPGVWYFPLDDFNMTYNQYISKEFIGKN